MSHFLLGVILPDHIETEDAESYLHEVMEPYDEDIVVDAYNRPCGCGTRRADNMASEIATEKTGLTWEMLRNTFHERPREDHSEEAWLKRTQPLREAEKQALAGLTIKPDPDCDNCQGSGTYPSTYNPKSKWDWWCIGGRWDGLITGLTTESEDDGLNFEQSHESIENNVTDVKNLTSDTMPFAFILPDGEWIQQGQMGWWGIVTREDVPREEWRTNRLEDIQTRYGGQRVVAVDCHI